MERRCSTAELKKVDQVTIMVHLPLFAFVVVTSGVLLVVMLPSVAGVLVTSETGSATSIVLNQS